MKTGFVSLSSHVPWPVASGVFPPAAPRSCRHSQRSPAAPCAGNANEAQGSHCSAHPPGMQSSPGWRNPGGYAGAVAQLVKLIESEEGWPVPTASPPTRSRPGPRPSPQSWPF